MRKGNGSLLRFRNSIRKEIEMEIEMNSYYNVIDFTGVELPDGKTLKDVKSVNQKWTEIEFEFKDGTTWECECDESENHEFYKRPYKIIVNDDEDELVFEE